MTHRPMRREDAYLDNLAHDPHLGGLLDRRRLIAIVRAALMASMAAVTAAIVYLLAARA